MTTAKKIGQNIKLARKAKGLTQKEVGLQLKMTQQQYSRFENGIFQFNYDQIIRLSSILGISFNNIFSI